MPSNNSLKQQMFAGALVANNAGRPGFLTELRVPLEPEDLSDPAAQSIFKAARVAAEYTTHPTAQALAEIILVNGWAGEDAPIETILSVVNDYAERGASSPAAFNNCAAFVMEDAAQNKIGRFAANVSKIVSSPVGTARQQFEKLSDELMKAKPVAIESTALKPDDLRRRATRYKDLQHGMIGKRILGLPSEFDDVATKYVKTLKPGNLYTVLGRPGRGKSVVLDMITERNFRMGFKVILFHLEDSVERKLVRQACRLTGCTIAELEAGDPRGKFEESYKILKGWEDEGHGQLIWVHCPGVSGEWIHRMVSQLGGADLVVIDYAQKLATEHYKGQNEVYMLAKAVDGCKNIAEDPRLNCAVVLGSQVTEGVGDVEQGWGTKAFEMYSQAVIAINRKRLGDYDPPEVVNEVQLAGPRSFSIWVKLSVTKNNDGTQGSSLLVANGPRFKFEGVNHRALRSARPNAEIKADRLRAPSSTAYQEYEKMQRAIEAVTTEILPPPKSY